MRKLLAIALILLSPALAFAAGTFLAGIEDVPVPPGFAENQGAGVTFDSPGGRIIEAVASGPGSKDEVVAFYAQSLPQLGWTRISDSEYRSDSETLRLTFEQAKKQPPLLSVHYNLTPNH